MRSEDKVKRNSVHGRTGADAVQDCLRIIHSRDSGRRRDCVETGRTLRKTASEGNADSQFDLGYMYLKGQGVSIDAEKAFAWFLRIGRSTVVGYSALWNWVWSAESVMCWYGF